MMRLTNSISQLLAMGSFTLPHNEWTNKLRWWCHHSNNGWFYVS